MPALCWEVICKRPVNTDILSKPEAVIIRLIEMIVTPYCLSDTGSDIVLAILTTD